MNLKLSNVISDITGETGMGIIKAIAKGERNPDELIKHCRRGLKNTKETIKKSLEGNYSEEHIFILQQDLELYEFYQKKIVSCESEMEKLLNSFPSNDSSKPIESNSNGKEISQKEIHFQIREHLERITGVDLLAVKGFNTGSVLTILSEVGNDMSKWKTEKHFTNWLGLSPNNKITGGKVLSSKTKKTKSYASKTFRLCAQSLANSHSYLGGFYRRLKARLGAPKANVATARKLAVIFYSMLKKGMEYKELGCNHYDEKYREKTIRNLKKKAELFGLTIVDAKPA